MVRAKGGRPHVGFLYPFLGSDSGRKAKADTEKPSALEKRSIVSMHIFEGDGPLQGQSSEQSPEDTRLSPGAPASSCVWLDAIAKYTEYKTEFCAMGVFRSQSARPCFVRFSSSREYLPFAFSASPCLL